MPIKISRNSINRKIKLEWVYSLPKYIQNPNGRDPGTSEVVFQTGHHHSNWQKNIV